jgi:hypothetical protein
MEKAVPIFKSFRTIFYLKCFKWGKILFGSVKLWKDYELNWIVWILKLIQTHFTTTTPAGFGALPATAACLSGPPPSPPHGAPERDPPYQTPHCSRRRAIIAPLFSPPHSVLLHQRARVHPLLRALPLVPSATSARHETHQNHVKAPVLSLPSMTAATACSFFPLFVAACYSTSCHAHWPAGARRRSFRPPEHRCQFRTLSWCRPSAASPLLCHLGDILSPSPCPVHCPHTACSPAVNPGAPRPPESRSARATTGVNQHGDRALHAWPRRHHGKCWLLGQANRSWPWAETSPVLCGYLSDFLFSFKIPEICIDF